MFCMEDRGNGEDGKNPLASLLSMFANPCEFEAKTKRENVTVETCRVSPRDPRPISASGDATPVEYRRTSLMRTGTKIVMPSEMSRRLSKSSSVSSAASGEEGGGSFKGMGGSFKEGGLTGGNLKRSATLARQGTIKAEQDKKEEEKEEEEEEDEEHVSHARRRRQSYSEAMRQKGLGKRLERVLTRRGSMMAQPSAE